MGKDKDKRGKHDPSEAERADPLFLYINSVQRPETDIEFLVEAFEQEWGRPPLLVREDFCGTGYFSAEWVRTGSDRSAIGIDLDAPTLDWGRAHVLSQLSSEQQSRIQLRNANVLDVTEPAADVIVAMNFSFCVFKRREELEHYCRVAHRGLGSEGLFVLEIYGGTEAVDSCKEERVCKPDKDSPIRFKPFTYVWEQERFDPITNETLCHIHYRFKDGSKLKRAFTYDWRLWSIPEIRECLLGAGFSRVDVHWENLDEELKEYGGKLYRKTEHEENQAGYLCFVVGVK